MYTQYPTETTMKFGEIVRDDAGITYRRESSTIQITRSVLAAILSSCVTRMNV